MGGITIVRKSQLKADLILAAVLMALPALLFWKVVFGGEVLYWGTPLLQFFPWRRFAVDSYLSGQIPLWNPYLGNGAPLAANWQSAVFYPLNVIYLLFPVEKAMGYSVVLHVGLAGVFTYVLGRAFGLSRFGSFIAGLAYAFSGFVISRAGFLSMTSTAPWLPLILAIAEGILQRKTAENRRGAHQLVLLGALAVGLQLLAGHGQLSFYSLLLVAVYTLFRSWQLSSVTPSLSRGPTLGTGFLAPLGMTKESQLEMTKEGSPVNDSRGGGPDDDVGVGARIIGEETAEQSERLFVSPRITFSVTLSRSEESGVGRGTPFLPRFLAGCPWARNDRKGGRYRTSIGACLTVFGMLVLGVGLAAAQLLPTAELAMSSIRAGGAGYDFAMAYSLLPWQLFGLVAPDFFGNPAAGNYWGPGNYWETSGYVGVLPLLAAGLGLLAATRWSKVPRWFFASTIVVSIVFALGWYLPIYPFVFNHLPGFGFFQAPARFLLLYTLAVAVLAGGGCDALLDGVGSMRFDRLAKLIFALGIGICLAMGAFILVFGGANGVKPTFVSALAKFGALLAASGLLILLGKWLPKRWWQVAIAVFVAADLLAFGLPLNPTTDPRVYASGEEAATSLLQGASGLFRVYTPDAAFLQKFFAACSFRSFGSSDPVEAAKTRETGIPDVLMTSGLQESYNYDPLQVGLAKQFLEMVDSSGLDPRLLDLMNVRYVLSDTLPANAGLQLVSTAPDAVYENPDFLARAYIVTGEVVRAKSSREAFQELAKPSFDPRRSVVLVDPPQTGLFERITDWLSPLYPANPSNPAEMVVSGGGNVVFADYSPQRVALTVVTNSPGYLVLSDTYYPGWKAWVNGQPASIYQANGAFRAVAVPASRSAVEFRYEPVTFKLGETVSVLSLAVVLAIAAWVKLRRRAS